MAGFLELGKEAAKGFTALMQARAVEASSKVKVPQQLAPAQSRPVQPGQQQLPAPAPQPTPEQIAQAQARARQLQAEAAARAAQQQAPQAKPAPVAAVEPVATEGRPSETRLEELLRRVQSYENPETVAHSFYSYVQSDFGLQNEMNAVGGDPVALFSKYLEPWAMANLAKAGPYAMELNRQIEKVGQELGLLEVEEEEGEEEVDGAEQAGAAVNEAVNGALVAAEVVPPPAEELQQAQA